METTTSSDSRKSALLADPSVRAALERFVRTRVPPDEVEDVVQATLTDALAAAKAPDDPEELRRWVHGIARHKVADFFRARERDPVPDSAVGCDVAAQSAPHGAHDLLRWAERELPEGEQAEHTLEWMLREGDGEKLEHIAETEDVPAPRVRQRVSRLRRYYRERWVAQAVALALAVAFMGALIWILRDGPDAPTVPIAEEPPSRPTPEEVARALRRAALDDCRAERWTRCLEGLDEARRLDPRGDEEPAVAAARRAAVRATAPPVQDAAPAPSRSASPPETPETPETTEAPPPPPPRPTSDPSDPRPPVPKTTPRPTSPAPGIGDPLDSMKAPVAK